MREGQKTGQARKLRRTANRPEQQAWATLRKLRAQGFPVRRQHPIGPYVADFAVVAERLVIEIDGGIHRLREREDERRQAAIEAMGWRVLRFGAQEALSADHLLARVTAALHADAAPSPPAPLPQAGEGRRTP